jgi:4-diphosphocytidyl-2-C-methyl-D-erythritol kinase
MRSISVETPAKVNLILDVLARREDGFHEIRSLMSTIDLCDRVTVEMDAAGAIEVECAHPLVPADTSNLVCRAAQALRQHLGHNRGCRIRLEKRIPVGAGLGGGSSDAAATLSALNSLWNAGLTPGELAELGASIGSDVPFFFSPPCAIVSGRGDRVAPTRMLWTGWIALVMAGVHVSTRDVFDVCVPGVVDDHDRTMGTMQSLSSAAALRPYLRNGLEQAVFRVAPEVERMRDALREFGGGPMRVSGAGSVMFDLYDDEIQARAFVERARLSQWVDAAVAVRIPAPRR